MPISSGFCYPFVTRLAQKRGGFLCYRAFQKNVTNSPCYVVGAYA